MHLVGAVELQNLCKAVTRIGNSISKKILSHNTEVPEDEKIIENEVFNSIMSSPTSEENSDADAMSFWKCVEQIAIIKIALQDLILSIEGMTVLNFDESEFEGLREEHKEYSLKYHQKYENLKVSAETLLDGFDEMFNQQILNRVDKMITKIFKIRRE